MNKVHLVTLCRLEAITKQLKSNMVVMVANLNFFLLLLYIKLWKVILTQHLKQNSTACATCFGFRFLDLFSVKSCTDL